LFGEQDFVQYWTAFHFFVQGQNPYDPAATQTLQCSLGHDCNHVLIAWNPPWFLILMAPVLWLPFSLAAKAWVLVGLVLGALSVFLVTRTYGTGFRAVLYAILGVFISTPMLLTLGYGQTGTLILFGCALLLHGRAKTKSNLQQAIALVILLVKPHLFLLVGVALFWDEIANKRLTLIAYTAVILIVMTGALTLVSPIVLQVWIDHFWGSSTGAGVVGLTEWNTPTVSNFLRLAAKGLLAERANALLIATPLCAALLVVIWLWREPNLCWRRILPPLLVLSMWLAPYGWAYDWAAMGILQAALLCGLAESGSNRRLWIATAVIVIAQTIAMYLTFGLQLSLETLIWLPAVLLALWYGAATTGPTADTRITGKTSALLSPMDGRTDVRQSQSFDRSETAGDPSIRRKS
jgi:hypothetical protein